MTSSALTPQVPKAGRPDTKKRRAIRLAMQTWLALLAAAIFLSAGLIAMRAATVVQLFNTPVEYGTVQTSKTVQYGGTPYYEATVSLPHKRLITATYAMNLSECKEGDTIPIRAGREVGRVDSITELYELPRTVRLLFIMLPSICFTRWMLKRYQPHLGPLDLTWFKACVIISICLAVFMFVSRVPAFLQQ